MSRLSLSIITVALLLLSHAVLANGIMDVDMEEANFCVDHGDCPAFYECIQLECVTLDPGVCRKDSDCSYENSMYCETETSTCRYFCYNDYDCEEYEYCDIGKWHCLPKEEGDADGFCSSDEDCDEATQYCETITHTCRPKCMSTEECPDGWVCIDYKCQPESPGDLDWDMPWMDYEELGQEEFEIPDWEMPEVRVDHDTEPEIDTERYEYAESGGLGESGLNTGGDKDKNTAADKSSSSCMQTGANSVLPFSALLLLCALLRRRRA